MKRIIILITVIILSATANLYSQTPDLLIPPFTSETASKFANKAFSCISSEYPNHITHLLSDDSDVKKPSQLHPAFYGCYTWHSSVNSHWLLVKMLAEYPDLSNRDQIIDAIDKNLTKKNIEGEVEYFKKAGRLSFERPYGWAWLLKLASELVISDTDYAKKWYANLLPLIEEVKKRYYEYLPSLYYPVRHGVLDNTAFGIAFALDYAKASGDKTFETFLTERAKFYYFNDNNIPANLEPDGDDFFSPSLIEADLMRRVLSKEQFVKWFKYFMPEIPFSLIYPAVVVDRNDPKGINLIGLNLSRAWCMFELAKVIPDDSQTHRDLWQAGYRHAAESLSGVMYETSPNTQWLSVFAVYMYMSLSDVQQ
jgi:uncharacterized protein YneR